MPYTNSKFKISAEIKDPIERRTAVALEAAQIGVFELEPATSRVFWDSRMRELWGIPDDEDITYDTVIAQVHPDDRNLHDTVTAATLELGGSRHMDMEYRVFPRGDQPMRWVHAIANCYFENNAPIRLVGTVQDITKRRMTEERNKLLMYELEHRVKNTLTTAISVVRLSRMTTNDFDAYMKAVQDRLLAMAASHQVLRKNNWQAVTLGDIVLREARSFLGADSGRLTISGPSLLIPAELVLTMSLAIHELLTNASKHGSLRASYGSISLQTLIDNGRAKIIWTEKGMPVERPPIDGTTGFGSFLLTKVLAAEFKAEVEHDLRPDGAVFAMDFPLEARFLE